MRDKLTKGDIEKMQKEIDYRELELRPGLIEEVKETRAQGDLSENFEYHAAKRAKNRNDSRIRYLQNISDVADFSHQGIALALCLADDLLGMRGACRVHGGGFAGTTLNFVPKDLLPAFIERLDGAFRPGACIVLSIRKEGAIRVL